MPTANHETRQYRQGFEAYKAGFIKEANPYVDTHQGTVIAPDKMRLWDEGWEKRFGALLGQGDDAIVAFRNEFKTMLERQKYPAVTEIGARSAGRILLNIGCGGGHATSSRIDGVLTVQAGRIVSLPAPRGR